ncbi:HAD family hydrolase [Lysinibacillus yapensis]|uniref:HAD family hydrolase n=1 Tax=Ureibacillus yapensis TaxID=2304605 RepID=A0A396S5G9_9BACL|nr:HAD family hydrolase [Lysinibacillus yapensis]RHW34735.1 HAD family hydrolase [Lysinibacillus yapensis]
MTNKYIWFDIGYTLLYQQREQVYVQYLKEQKIEMPFEKIEEAYHYADKLFMREYPGVLGKQSSFFYHWYLGIVNHYLELAFDLESQNRFIQKGIQETKPYWLPFSFTKDVLHKLRQEGYRLGIISNWDESGRQLLDYHNLTDYFDNIIISCEVGVEKPSKAIFEKAFKQGNTTNEESIYIGDNYYDDVVGGGKVGLKTYLINRFRDQGIEEIQYPYIIESINELPSLLKEENVYF